MKTVNFIKENDLPFLLPIIEEFSSLTETPFSLHLHEVAASLFDEAYCTLIGKEEDKIVSYLSGNQISRKEFMIAQIYSSDPQLTKIMGEMLDDYILERGMSKCLGLFKHDNVRFLQRYGFKVERYLVGKEIKKEK